MSLLFEELDHRDTPMGTLSLRRRRSPGLDAEVYEIKLDDDFLMSSLFTEAEETLARLGLAPLVAVAPAPDLSVVVGGLGLGYTARAALAHREVGALLVVERLATVIDWHVEGLLPLGPGLTGDPRCRLVEGDFFALAAAPDPGFDPAAPGQRFDAVLLDVDHSPRNLLHPDHAAFYRPDGLRRLAGQLRPGGVFALWSNDPPDADFATALEAVFATQEAHVVRFRNPLSGEAASNTVYVARRAPAPR